MPRLGSLAPLWAAFLFCAVIGVAVGSIGTDLSPTTCRSTSSNYFEGFFFFLYGMMALREDRDVLRFMPHLVVVALGVAFMHFFCIATGFRFRSALVDELYVYYGGVLGNTNELGSIYVMVVPIALSLLIRERLARSLAARDSRGPDRDVRIDGALGEPRAACSSRSR